MQDPVHHYDSDLWNWGEAMHSLMTRLGERLGNGRYTERQVIALLGKPDQTLEAGRRSAIGKIPAGESRLVYWWRGGHDYLFFVVREGRVVKSDWWYAGE